VEQTVIAVDQILHEALRVSRDHDDARVVRLDIELSPSGHIDPEAVRRELVAEASGTAAEGAELSIVTAEHHYRCSSCGQLFTSPAGSAAVECPACEESAVALERPGVCVLTSVEVANPASGSD